LKKHGLDYDIVVYPFGEVTDLSLKVARRYHKMGVNIVRKNLSNSIPYIDNLNLTRVAGLSQKMNFDGDIREPTLEECKAIVDNAIANKEWIIFEDHSGYPIWDSHKLGELRQLIQYVKSKGVPIVNFQDGFNMKANIIDIKSEVSHYKLFRNGLESRSGFEDKTYDNNTPVTYFPMGESRTFFTNSESLAKGFPEGRAGVLTTFRVESGLHNNVSDYQTFKIYDRSTIYMRSWDGSAWGQWQVVANPLVNATLNAYSADDGIVLYPPYSITVFRFDSNGKDGMPVNAGTVTTYRLGVYGWDKQEVREYNGNRIWSRYSLSSTQWSEWERITPDGGIVVGAVDSRQANDPISNYPKNAIEYVNISKSNPTISSFPEQTHGTLITTHTGIDVYAFQKYEIRGGFSVYKRYWDTSNSVWSDWQKISAV